MALRQELDGETIIPSRDERAYLRLDAEGFTAQPVHGRPKHRAWDDVSGFKPVAIRMTSPDGIRGPKMLQIGFFLRDPPKKGRVGRKVVRWFMGVDDSLPGVYPNAEEIVELMERWRERHS
jgi:hypothetical protein